MGAAGAGQSAGGQIQGMDVLSEPDSAPGQVSSTTSANQSQIQVDMPRESGSDPGQVSITAQANPSYLRPNRLKVFCAWS